MPCHTRIKQLMKGLLWLFLIQFGFDLVISLEPGFLDFDNLPDTNFTCVGKVIGGYYADLETNCQMFHVCTIGQLEEPMDIRFLCLNGTVFDQETRVCERIDEVDCSKSEQFYSLNLELYGNTQPPILEEDLSSEDKSSTTSTSTTQKATVAKPTLRPYFTTPLAPTTTRNPTNVITSHHFPVANAPDIRFNPEEINISLHPHAPPDITRSNVPVSFQHQSLSNSETNTKVTITTHTDYKLDKPQRISLLNSSKIEDSKVQSSSTPKSVVSYGLTHDDQRNRPNPKEVNYGFSYQQTEEAESLDYPSRTPIHPYRYQLDNQQSPSIKSHPYLTYHTTTKRTSRLHYPPTTFRSTQSTKHQQYQPEETKRLNLQLPSPLFPTLPPISFSSPAPFSLAHHPETKRFTQNHNSPPRIVISASASVSDNNGRRLNYSLGTIGATHLLGPSPPSYDDYKEEDVVLDPFYHDVPKIKKSRQKRSASQSDKEDDLLNFLFDLYKKREMEAKVPVILADAVEINSELKPVAVEENVEKQRQGKTMANEMKKKGFTNKEVGLITEFFEQIIEENKAERFSNKATTQSPSEVTSIFDESFTTESNYRLEEQQDYFLDPKQEVVKENEGEKVTEQVPTDISSEPTQIFDEFPTTEFDEQKGDFFEISKIELTDGTIATDSNNNTVESFVLAHEENLDFSQSTTQTTLESNETQNPFELISNEVTATTDASEITINDFTDNLDNLQEVTTSNPETTTTNVELFKEINLELPIGKQSAFDSLDYVDDNYEPMTYQEPQNISNQGYYSEHFEKSMSSEEEIKKMKIFKPQTTTTIEELLTTNLITTTELPETTTFYDQKQIEQSTNTEPTIAITENLIPTQAIEETTTERLELSTTRYQYLKTRPPWYKRPNTSKRKEFGSHRFSTPNGVRKKEQLNLNLNNEDNNLRTTPTNDEIFVTEAPLLKSANPTKAKYTKIVFTTTPLSKLIHVEVRREKPGQFYTFNCFDKEVHKFYADPRDCRLFHYCTFGFTKTQMLDMKFVCDFGTFFDDEKLICSRVKPLRCT